jgi:hypothetical protein
MHIKFLELFGASHCFQWFDDTKSGRVHPGHAHLSLDTTTENLLSQTNSQGGGIYFVVNQTDGSGRRRENIVAPRALFLDLDGSPLEPVLEGLVRPSAVIQTSIVNGIPKYHAYWICKNIPLNEWSSTQRALATKFNGDQSVNDLPRVARVPGFLNWKYGDPQFVSVVEMDGGVYDYEQLMIGLGLDVGTATIERSQPLLSLGATANANIGPGERHETLLRQARKYAAEGYDEQDLLVMLRGLNQSFNPPRPSGAFEVEANNIILAVKRYEGGVLGGKIDLSSLTKRTDIEVQEYDEENNEELPIKRIRPYIPDELAINAPGIVGELVHRILAVSLKPQPALALQAALAAMATLKGRKYRLMQGVGTPANLYTIGIAPTGSGKDHAQKCVSKLFTALGLPDIEFDVPVSGAGIAASLARSEYGLACMDEVGHVFAPMFASRPDARYQEISRTILRLFSTSSVKGSDYSARSNIQRTEIKNAHYNIMGCTTPVMMSRFVLKEHVESGFWGRFLFFTSSNDDPELTQGAVDTELYSEELLNKIKIQMELGGYDAEPYRLEPDTKARLLMKDLQLKWDNQMRGSSDYVRGIYARAYEQFERVLIAVCNRQKPTPKVIAWTEALIESCLAIMIDAVYEEKVSPERDREIQDVERALNYIYNNSTKEHGKHSCSKRDFTRYLQRKTARERQSIMAELVEAELVTVHQKAQLGSGGRTKTIYKAIRQARL